MSTCEIKKTCIQTVQHNLPVGQAGKRLPQLNGFGINQIKYLFTVKDA